jgi:hypothetical protein
LQTLASFSVGRKVSGSVGSEWETALSGARRPRRGKERGKERGKGAAGGYWKAGWGGTGSFTEAFELGLRGCGDGASHQGERCNGGDSHRGGEVERGKEWFFENGSFQNCLSGNGT